MNYEKDVAIGMRYGAILCLIFMLAVAIFTTKKNLHHNTELIPLMWMGVFLYSFMWSVAEVLILRENNPPRTPKIKQRLYLFHIWALFSILGFGICAYFMFFAFN